MRAKFYSNFMTNLKATHSSSNPFHSGTNTGGWGGYVFVQIVSDGSGKPTDWDKSHGFSSYHLPFNLARSILLYMFVICLRSLIIASFLLRQPLFLLLGARSLHWRAVCNSTWSRLCLFLLVAGAIAGSLVLTTFIFLRWNNKRWACYRTHLLCHLRWSLGLLRTALADASILRSILNTL